MNIITAAAICYGPDWAKTDTDMAERAMMELYREQRECDEAIARLKPHLPRLNARLAAAGYADDIRALEIALINARALLRGLVSAEGLRADLAAAETACANMRAALEE